MIKRRKTNSDPQWDTRRIRLDFALGSINVIMFGSILHSPAMASAVVPSGLLAEVSILGLYFGIVETGRVLLAPKTTEQTVTNPPAETVTVTTTETKGEPSGPVS